MRLRQWVGFEVGEVGAAGEMSHFGGRLSFSEGVGAGDDVGGEGCEQDRMLGGEPGRCLVACGERFGCDSRSGFGGGDRIASDLLATRHRAYSVSSLAGL